MQSGWNCETMETTDVVAMAVAEEFTHSPVLCVCAYVCEGRRWVDGW